MCLAIPGKVLETYEEHGLAMGKVDFGGVLRAVCLEHVPGAGPGKYVLVHVGFALQVLEEAEALRVFEYLEQIGELEELPPEGGAGEPS